VDTIIDEIAPQIYRFSTFISQAGIVFNQFLIDADEPLLFHTGQRMLFPQLHEAMRNIIDPKRLRWILFGHYEADECGAMNDWLRAAPNAVIAHGTIGVRTSIADQADRAPRSLIDGEIIDLGNKRVRYMSTPHVPHGWDAGLIFEETTGTLFASDLFTRLGDDGAFTDADIVGPALVAEDRSHATALTPSTAPTIRRLAELPIKKLALMHAPTFLGDGRRALLDLADAYAELFRES
jgi:flavorubredoxin